MSLVPGCTAAVTPKGSVYAIAHFRAETGAPELGSG
jgi:hypothetical protein